MFKKGIWYSDLRELMIHCSSPDPTTFGGGDVMVAQKIVLLRKSFRIFGGHDVLLRCFNPFILPCLEYCSPVWSSAADSHLRLLDKNLRACKFLIPNLS